MPSQPRVSIVIPAFNDEEWIAASLDSCLAQTQRDIEVIVVDDASTDATCDVVESYRQRDPRIRLIRHPENRSAFQARRSGIFAASADRLLFVDGDDLLAPTAVRDALARADQTGADVIGFGVDVLVPGGLASGKFAREMQPKHQELHRDEIMSELFPPGKTAQGQLWRYLWNARLLREAYLALPEALELYRANDIPIAFLALASADSYASVPTHLYRYHLRRGGSGHAVADVTTFTFYLGALDSIDAIGPAIDALAGEREDGATLRASYRSARLSVMHTVLRYCVGIEDDDVQDACFAILHDRADPTDLILSAAIHLPAALPLLARHASPAPDVTPNAKRIAITTNNLRAGGLQGVAASQARFFAEAGYEVTIAARSAEDVAFDLPRGVEVVEMTGGSAGEKVSSLIDIVRRRKIDVVLNHWLLYDEVWPFAALAARSIGVRMIGWLHNFALRPVYDFNRRNTLLATYLPLLERTVVLSEADVAFWKLRGVDNAVYLPNPPSPLLLDIPYHGTPRTLQDRPIRLVWWGRLQQHTKRVRDLISVASTLRALDVAFELAIIGPESDDTTADDMRELIDEAGVQDAVTLHDAMHGRELMDQLERSDLYVSLSAIEGYPLTLVEAQAVGLPVAMYELPWLAVVQGNDGIIAVPQRDAHALAVAIRDIASNPHAYAERSAASLAAAHEALRHNFATLNVDLLTDRLSPKWSPEPTLEDARLLLNLSVQFSESVIGRERRHGKKLADQRNRARREAERLRLEIAKFNEPNVVTGVRPIGRVLLRLIPGLRPAARKFNRWVRGL